MRTYLSLNLSVGYPAGESIFYECAECETMLPSMPAHAMACKCRNIVVDSDAGRVSVKDVKKIRVFKTE